MVDSNFFHLFLNWLFLEWIRLTFVSVPVCYLSLFKNFFWNRIFSQIVKEVALMQPHTLTKHHYLMITQKYILLSYDPFLIFWVNEVLRMWHLS